MATKKKRRRRPAPPVHTYLDGQPYQPPRGRMADRDDVETMQPLTHSVISGRPTPRQFLLAIKRELKIRGFSHHTNKNYISRLRRFLSWFGNRPNLITREDVRCYLETIVDGGGSTSQLSASLSAIRTGFDKMCLRDVTLGLVTPRRPKQQPVVLAPNEVTRILNAAPTRPIKLAIGIMYAAGLRNSELCRLKVTDIDFDRQCIAVRQGKGKSDRTVMLPQTFRQHLRSLCENRSPNDFLFPSTQHRANRHISPRTLQRWVKVAVSLAGVAKHITPHSFRHAFATHLLENGTDIRFIQKLLGHQRLETTTIYTHVARVSTRSVTSPIDQLTNPNRPDSNRPDSNRLREPGHSNVAVSPPASAAVGKLVFHFKDDPKTNSAKVTIEIKGDSQGRKIQRRLFLTGVAVSHSSHQWLSLELPPPEQWAPTLRQLPRRVQDRIDGPEFYELLRSEISKRFLSRSAAW